MTPVSHIGVEEDVFERGARYYAQLASMITTDTANRFVAARRAGRALPDYPGPIPDTLAAAYLVQDAAIKSYGQEIIGWKVGRIFPPLSEQFGADRLAGPIFSATEQDAANPSAGRIFAGGFGAAEAEFLIRIGSDLPRGKHDYTLDDAALQIAAIHVGIEIASSPLATINELGPAVTISDFGNNNGLVIGPQIVSWQTSDFAKWDVVLEVDAVQLGRGSADSFPDGPIGSLRFLLNNLGSRNIAIRAGTWISTGAVTGVHQVTAGQYVSAVFGDRHTVSCSIEAAPVA